MTPKLKAFLEEYKALHALDDQMDYLLELAEEFKEVPEHIAKRPFSESSRVPSCQSEVFVFCSDFEDGTCKFHFAVDNPHGISAKALAVIIDKTMSGEATEEVLAVPATLIQDIFGSSIGMGKGQGLTSMLEMVKGLARNTLPKKI